jgi:hypothetical protein
MEGHYSPELWRRFVRVDQAGEQIISIVHRAGGVIPLKAIFPTARCAHQGLIGLEMYTLPSDPDDHCPLPSFMLSASTENVRCNLNGENVADGLFEMYPRSTIQTRRKIDFMMNEIPHPITPDQS